jgi:putative transposase
VDEALIPRPRKVRVSRKAASDALAARIAGDSPKPYAEEMEINRLKTSGDGLGRLPAIEECFDVEAWETT